MKKVILFFLFFTRIALVFAQDTTNANLNSKLLALSKNYKSVASIFENYSMKVNTDSSISEIYKIEFGKFSDTLITAILNTKIKCENPVELYLSKHDLSILELQPFKFSEDDILKYRIYAGLGYLRQLICSPEPSKSIDSIKIIYAFVNTNIKKEYFSGFSQQDRDYINILILDSFLLLEEHEEEY